MDAVNNGIILEGKFDAMICRNVGKGQAYVTCSAFNLRLVQMRILPFRCKPGHCVTKESSSIVQFQHTDRHTTR